MRTLVFDSTPLIYLAKVDLLDLLNKLPEEKIIPKAVYLEVAKEKYQDALKIVKAVERGIFKVESLQKKEFYLKLSGLTKLHKADAEALALAKELNGCVIMDEKFGRGVAEQEGIACGSTMYVFFRLLKSKLITKSEFKKKLNEMITAGWYCSSEFYIRVIELLDVVYD